MATQAPFEVEHVIPLKHLGETTLENLALACLHCNRHKGANVSGIKQPGGRLIRLFHPRQDDWARHFQVRRGAVVGKTDVGRITIQVLAMNRWDQVELRRLWFSAYPP